jgi:hypothetical protein
MSLRELVVATFLLALGCTTSSSPPDARVGTSDAPLASAPDAATPDAAAPDAAAPDAGCGPLDAGSYGMCPTECLTSAVCSLCTTTCARLCSEGSCWSCQSGRWSRVVNDCALVPPPDAG